ncbi:uncharacterized protein LOC135498774 isoform X2 [Lineus longissimus]|uniref:uncharacterized protein LOC135498774 isoform X2 n=1 Tax=Lineus longissimus TaxID=88925 RepID=UPI002B4DA317
MAREGILFGYGNPLLDISVTCDKAFLDKYGLEANNAILADEKHVPMYQDIADTYGDEVQYIPGGATQNSIKIAQWLLGTKNATTFTGCIGQDKFGQILEKKCTDLGVNCRYQYTTAEKTGTCAVLVTGADRSLCAYLAAANAFTKDHLEKSDNWAFVEKAAYFYISSFPLTVCPEALLDIGQHANKTNKVFLLNLSAPFLCDFFAEPMMKVMPYVDVLFGNETEAVAFSKKQNLGTEDVAEIALAAAKLPKENKERARMVVFTQGENPTIVAYEGKTTSYPVIPLKPEELVDTNGAGDAFVGGFLAQYVQEKATEECIRCGNYTANLVIKRSGCTFPEKPDFH